MFLNAFNIAFWILNFRVLIWRKEKVIVQIKNCPEKCQVYIWDYNSDKIHIILITLQQLHYKFLSNILTVANI